VLHNTALPSLAQWIKSAADDRAKNLQPGITRISNLERFFKDENHWSGAPHLFIAPDVIWVFNPLISPGVHSPSFNATSIGIEMIGDFSKEDDDSGDGLRVKNNTIFATAILCSALGLEPESGEFVNGKPTGTIFLHKQDPKTTHDCPGANIARDKLAMIEAVKGLMDGGDHGDVQDVNINRNALVMANDLNLRSGPGVSNKAIGVLMLKTAVEIIGEAKNGSTGWSNVRLSDGRTGWVASRYLKENA